MMTRSSDDVAVVQCHEGAPFLQLCRTLTAFTALITHARHPHHTGTMQTWSLFFDWLQGIRGWEGATAPPNWLPAAPKPSAPPAPSKKGAKRRTVPASRSAARHTC